MRVEAKRRSVHREALKENPPWPERAHHFGIAQELSRVRPLRDGLDSLVGGDETLREMGIDDRQA